MNDILYHTKFLDLKSTTSKNGEPWYYAHRPHAKDIVVVIPETDNEVLFLIEERPPIIAEKIGKFVIGFPAGLVGDIAPSETIEGAIRKELFEETGLIADNIEIKSQSIASSAGCVSEIFTVAFAKISSKIPSCVPLDDGGIIVGREWVLKSEIKNWLKEKEESGYILTSQALSALFYMK